MNKPIVRFAPSPTGYLHIGGARTALFNWLYAKKNNGTFLLRIEDTDTERSEQKYVDQISDALQWLGLSWDDDVVYQSSNIERHQSVVNSMIENGTAYRCFLTKEELDSLRQKSEQNKEVFRVPKTYRDYTESQQQDLVDQGKPFTVRLKIPDGVTEFDDLVYGNIKVNNSDLDDFIIARSDGTPTYNFVVTIDDSDMNITHVIRGDDHLANTPKQILVYKALGLNVPTFAHLPMILGSDKKRLSKRHAATNVQEYRDKGYTSEAVLNYLSLLGWNPDSEQEIFNLDDLIDSFNLEQVQKKPATFDEKKLLWVSGQHMANISIDIIISELEKLNPNWGEGQSNQYKNDVLSLTKDRSKTLTDLMEISDTFFIDHVVYDMGIKDKIWNEVSSQIIDDLLRL
ncbi:MAG: glutamate--tRNA ligase [Candidatus Neomarinimicrobiota bacterium]|nr:MAG: glutamate--tRNA ligase [Candidatus Neomarinimicrobiota bacterium]